MYGVIFLGGAIFSNVALAEIITLKNGKKFEGDIVDANVRDFQIKDGERFYSIPYKLVDHIQSELTQEQAANIYIKDVIDNIDRVKQKQYQQTAERSKIIQSKKVEFYMTSWCPYCVKMERFLKKHKVNYERLDIDHSASANRRLRELGIKGAIPTLNINGQVIVGYNLGSVWKALIKKN